MTWHSTTSTVIRTRVQHCVYRIRIHLLPSLPTQPRSQNGKSLTLGPADRKGQNLSAPGGAPGGKKPNPNADKDKVSEMKVSHQLG
jgi:hypothetical protein